MSKIVTITLGGSVTPGDVVNLSYGAKGGGRTTAGHLVMVGQALSDIATGLAAGVMTYWCQGLFTAKANGVAITLICERGAEDVTISADVEHVVDGRHFLRASGGTETVTIQA